MERTILSCTPDSLIFVACSIITFWKLLQIISPSHRIHLCEIMPVISYDFFRRPLALARILQRRHNKCWDLLSVFMFLVWRYPFQLFTHAAAGASGCCRQMAGTRAPRQHGPFFVPRNRCGGRKPRRSSKCHQWRWHDAARWRLRLLCCAVFFCGCRHWHNQGAARVG
jgi:hypothetical protein